MMRFRAFALGIALLIALPLGLIAPHGIVQAQATFTVNSTGDAPDANPGDGVAETAPSNGVTTLRAAIQEANALAGPDTIILAAGTYTLTIAGADEDAGATGDLDITDDLTITGAGQATTIIDGGALDRVFHVITGSTVEISGVTVQNGRVLDGLPTAGGGIRIDGTLNLTDSTISNNAAAFGTEGGGIGNTGTLILTNSTVSGNTASSVGGIHNYGTVTITNSTVSGNSATAGGQGGGIFNSGILALVDSTVRDNFASGGGISGGGIVNQATLSLTGSTVSGNRANGDGGGIYNQIDTVTVVNSTITNNTAGRGGGIFNSFASLTVLSSTVSGNTSTDGGGVFNDRSANFANSIIANNAPGGDFGGASITSLGHNLDSDGTGGLSGPGDISGVDPLLGPLADNGGPTLTHALLLGSPAIDAGDNSGAPATDQRGVTRPIDGDGDNIATVDMGAYEYAPSAPHMVPSMSLWGGLAMVAILGLLMVYMVRRRQTALKV